VGQAPPFTYGVAGFPDDGFALDQLVNAADQQLLDYRRRTRGGDPGRVDAGAPAPTRSVPAGSVPGSSTAGGTEADETLDITGPASSGSPAPDRPVRRIAAMPWPEQDIEERLYELPDVLAARVSDQGGSLHVGVLVRPTTDRELLPDAILDRIQLAAGAVPETIDLRVMPLGATAETRLVRPAAGVGVTTAPVSAAGGSSATASPADPSRSAGVETAAPEVTVEPGAPAPVTTPSLTFASSPSSGPAGAVAPNRPSLARVTGTQEGSSFFAEVELSIGDRSVVRRTDGLAGRVGTNRLVAEATAAALDGLHDLGRQLGIEFVDLLASPVGDVAVVGVVIVDTAGERMVTGSASVRNGNRLDAIARAVLDATNRRR
jgi:hypothetical protein